MIKKTFKQILSETRKPKILTSEERLPYVFDLFWDIKYGNQILESWHYLENLEVQRCLAENGYDVQSLKELIKSRQTDD